MADPTVRVRATTSCVGCGTEHTAFRCETCIRRETARECLQIHRETADEYYEAYLIQRFGLEDGDA